MDTNKILGLRFKRFSKYTLVVGIVASVLFIICNAINTNSGTLYMISYCLMMVGAVGLLESVVLFGLSKLYLSRSEK